MVLDEREAEAALNALPAEQWQKLFALIPEIESTSNFGEVPCEEDEEGNLTISSFTEFAHVVWTFQDIVYDIPIAIDFGWMHWDQGKKALLGNEDLSGYDILFLCKLITMAVRAERFITGFLLDVFKSGRMLAVLKALENAVKMKNS